jgi:hypothetical protein
VAVVVDEEAAVAALVIGDVGDVAVVEEVAVADSVIEDVVDPEVAAV